MSYTTIIHHRLLSQQLLTSNLRSPHEVTSWMGAIQAQDLNMVKWAVGTRIPSSTERQIEEAFNKGEILRTHVLRPTWHLVSPENIRWMLELSKAQIMSITKSRDKNLEITEELYSKSNSIIRKALEGNNFLTREELTAIINKSGIVTDAYRMMHFTMRAELEAIICSGPMKEKKYTFALVDERVPKFNPLEKDEALAKLARLYFTSHGPATIQDFTWWSGLPISQARHALEMNKPDFSFITIDSQLYWFSGPLQNEGMSNSSAHLLPAFDEYIISYKDRQRLFPLKNHSKAISSNGIFRPTIMKDGLVIGIWKKSASKNKVLEPEFFEQPDDTTVGLIEKLSEVYNRFLMK